MFLYYYANLRYSYFPMQKEEKNGAQHVFRVHGSGDFSQVRQGLPQF